MLTTSKTSHEKEKLVILILNDESMHVIYFDNAHIKLKLVHSKVPMFQKKLFIEYRASAKGALAQGAISSTGTNSPSQVFYGNQFFVHVF